MKQHAQCRLANLVTGRPADSIGNRKAIFTLLFVFVLVMIRLPFAGANLWATVAAIPLWARTWPMVQRIRRVLQ